ncbi:fructose-specific PTS transporter subunit EIIC [Streptomyces sp. DG2A-72]|uniref:fructose-specific PTS transporter subunit EIIC n=1 Tax=Streptomyces sp. DG2A-72 TaxID=3051386 RepID=UPI00265C5428|nr:fructose-specific PTS transporter subunit EIIC [Streptomyces sp. DG2A-72]MDO0933903.1 fructose-specific PTS transporter subunit EIIC [Streptomyces sp. DG2A-72]
MSHPRKPVRPKQDTVPTPPFGFRTGRWLAAGVPWFAPFTAIAATMSVLALVISGPDLTDTADQILAAADWTQPHTWAALLLRLGASGLSFLPVAVAGHLAYGMAGRPALIPGILGGMAAMGAQGGILAGLLAGLVAGAATLALQRIPVPSALRDIASTALVPLLASLVTAAVIIAFVAGRLTALSGWLHGKLVWLEFHHLVLVGVLLGAMVCCDLGGAIGKTAIAFGTVGISGPDPSKFNPTDMTMMAAVVAAGMVPTLGMSLATLVRGRVFTGPERAYGKVAWLFGAAFIPEGAVPFALADPLRVIPAGMAGGAVTGALTMTFGTTTTVPYGGFLALGETGEPLLLVLAVAAGAVVTAATAVALKSLGGQPAARAASPAVRIRRKVSVAG